MRHRARSLSFALLVTVYLASMALVGCAPISIPRATLSLDATPHPSVDTIEATALPPPTPTSATNSPSQPPSNVLPEPPRPGQMAYDFRLEGLDGTIESLSDYRGRWVLLTFWASWCPACREGLAAMKSVYSELQSAGVQIVAVNVGDEREQAAAFVESHGLPFPVLLDPGGDVATAYYLRGIPSSLFLDEEGLIVSMHMGALSEARLLQNAVLQDD